MPVDLRGSLLHRELASRRLETRRRARAAALSTLAAVLACGLISSGCRGRAEFRRGEAHYESGDYRSAYRDFWQAIRLNPDSDSYRRACEQAGRQVARAERGAGRELERQGEFAAALHHYRLALEYAPEWIFVADDHARVRQGLVDLAALERRVEAAPPGSWERVHHLGDFLSASMAPEARQPEWSAALRAAVESRSRELSERTFGAALPAEERRLEKLQAGWENLRLELTQAQLELDRRLGATSAFGLDAVGLDAVGDDVASDADVAVLLERHLDECRRATTVIASVRRGLQWLRAAAESEASGVLDQAAQRFRSARLAHPGLEAAADGEARVHRARIERAYSRAVEAARAEVWHVAYAALAEMARLGERGLGSGQNLVEAARVAELERTVRRELTDELTLRAFELEDEGRIATALLCLQLATTLCETVHRFAADGVSTTDGVRAASEVAGCQAKSLRLRAARLRARLAGRGPAGTLEFKVALASDEWDLKCDLWRVRRAAADDLLEVVARAASLRSLPGHALKRTRRAGRAGGLGVVVLRQAEFWVAPRALRPGWIRQPMVAGMQLSPSQASKQATEELDAAQHELEQLLEAPDPSSALARGLLDERRRLASQRLHRMTVRAQALPRQLAELSWGERSAPTEHRLYQAALALEFELDQERLWVTAAEILRDRVVLPEADGVILSDPDDLPSRSDLLLRLARTVGQKLGDLVAERRVHWLRDELEKANAEVDVDPAAAAERYAVIYIFSDSASDPGAAQLHEAAAASLRRLLTWWP